MIKILKYGFFCNFKVFNHIRIGINSNFWGNMFLLFIFMISVIIGVGKYGEE